MLRGMKQARIPHAFTIIELLVALIIMGVAAAGLVGALTDDLRLRDLAGAHAFAAGLARERLELLAALPCSQDTSGTTASRWGSESWHAAPSRFSWSLTDSLHLNRSTLPLVIEARVLCPG